MGETGITIADILVVGLLLLSGLLAFARGFIREMLTIAGLIGAIAAALYGYPHLAPYAETLVRDSRLASFAAGCVIFVVAMVFFAIVSSAIGRAVRAAQLNAVDRSLGFAFGLVRGAAIISLLWIGLSFIWSTEELPPWIGDARSRPLVEAGAELLTPVAEGLKPLLFPGGSGGDGGTDLDAMKRTAEQAREAERMLRDMMAPEPKGPDTPDRGGYGTVEREDLERLIESSRSRP